MKLKGSTTGTVEGAKGATKSTGGKIQWISEDEGKKTIRCLTEPDEWYEYMEVWNDALKSYHATYEGMDRELEARAKKKFLINVVDVNADRVVALKIGVDIANRLLTKYDRYDGTIKDRNYTIWRMGSGLNTNYDVETEAPTPFNFDKYEAFDLEEVLIEQLKNALGDEDVLQADDDDVYEDEVTVDPAALKQMGKGELKKLAQAAGIDVDGLSKAELIEEIIDAAE